jgi:hypothetical protein
MIRKFFLSAGLCIIVPVGADANTISVCTKDPRLFQDKVLPELNTGISKHIAALIRCGDEVKTVLVAEMKRNLWKNTFELSVGQTGLANFQGSDDFGRAVCNALDFAIPTPCEKEETGELVILLNPNNEAISNLMEDWSERNAGVYRNMGIRLRWKALSEIEKSEKIIFKTRLGGQ